MKDEVMGSLLSVPRLKKLTSISVCCFVLVKSYITGVCLPMSGGNSYVVVRVY